MNNIFQLIYTFFNCQLITIIGGISTVIMIVVFSYTAFLFFKGIIPVWWRLGIGLSRRKIAVFSESKFSELESMLKDSKIFSQVIQIHKSDLKKAEDETVFLVRWSEFKDVIDEILKLKKDSTALIIYAPQNEGRILDPDMEKINSNRNSIVVNMRGRLVNDILISLITTGYGK